MAIPLSGVKSSDDSLVDIHELLDEFYASPTGHDQLATFCAVESVPSPYDSLLDHHAHMTVTVERHYGEKVAVEVDRWHRRDRWYSREIVLVTQQSRQVVQYGIVRLDTTALQPEVWKKIESRTMPLGRVLIEHNVLREVQLCGLWQVTAGPRLAQLLQIDIGQTTYGRTALIYCNRAPAIELLEIVAPCNKHSPDRRTEVSD